MFATFRSLKHLVRIGLVAVAVAGIAATAVWAQHGEPQHPIEGTPQSASTHGAAAGAAPAPSIMQVEPGLIIWTIVTFVVLMVVLRFTAWGPLLKALAAREARIRTAIEGAEAARQQSEERLAQLEQRLQQANEEARRIIDEGKSDGVKLRNEIAATARNEAEEFKARARRELELATDQVKKELWEHSTQLSIDLASRILGRSLSSDDHRRLVDRVLEEYRTVSSSSAESGR